MKKTWILMLLMVTGLTLAQSTAKKSVSSFIAEAPQLGGTRKIWIYLPPDYQKSEKKYPVLYMHDGQNLFDQSTSFAGEWNVDETLDSLKLKIIVVGIENGGEKRIDELTPFPHEKYGGGKADAYLDFLVSTLKPRIDREYRTLSDKEHTSIMGSSLGGIVSFYALVKYPGVFSKAGIFSPAFWINPELFKMAETAPDTKSKMYFLCGDSESPEMVPDFQRMVGILKRKDVGDKKIQQQVVPGGQHNEKLWREHFGEAVIWLFGP